MNKDELIQNKILAAFHLNKEPCINIKVNKNFIDLRTWVSASELENFIFDNSIKNLEIKVKVKNKIIHNLLLNCHDYSEFETKITTKGMRIEKKTLDLIKKKWGQPELANIFLSSANNSLEDFNNLSKEAKSKYKENAVWTLFIGAYFLVGKHDSTVIAPLINIPVKVRKTENNSIVLQKIMNSATKFTINEKLNYWINKELKLSIPSSIPRDSDWFNHYKVWLKDYVNPSDFDNKTITKAVFDPSEVFEIKPAAVLDLYDPTGGVVMRDYQKISNSNVDPFKIMDMLVDRSSFQKEVINKDDVLEINKPLNIYQKYAIASALKTPTLIYGPPGTGKSEVIANLIANIVNQNKNVLVCSEKAAALNVIEKRLGSLSCLSLSAYDINDKQKFFDKIVNIYNRINNGVTTKKIVASTPEYDNLLGFLIQSRQIVDVANKYGGIENIEELLRTIDLVHFENLCKNQYFEKILSIALNNHQEGLENQFDWLCRLRDFYNNNVFLFGQLATNDFDNFTRNDINKFLCKYEKKKKDSSLGKFLKFSRKDNFLKHDPTPSLTRKKWEDFIDGLRSLNIIKLDWNEIAYIKELNWQDFNSFNSCLNLKHFFEDLKKSDYQQLNLLNKLWTNYEKTKKGLAENNADKIVENYLLNFKNKYQKMSQEERYKYNEMFSKASHENRPDINKFIREYFDCLKNIFPIWCLSPIQTCSTTKCEPNIFNYGIFDEASQMFVENAIPLVYRCTLNTVAGDDKQLQPTSFFMSRDFENLAYSDEDDDFEDDEVDSLFEQAKSSLWNTYYLKNHYRSDNASLIDFSNKYIYSNTLKTATKNGCLKTGLEVYTLPEGIYENRINTYEAEALVNHLINNYTKKDHYLKKTVLVITFSVSQKEYIEKLFKKMTYNKLWLTDAWNSDLITFKNLENVQGDEADIVYLSVCYAKNADGVLRQAFGPLSCPGGENRLNVAITRAKEHMNVFKSIVGSDITNTTNKHTKVFGEFISYCDGIEASIKNSDYVPLDAQLSDNDIVSVKGQIYHFLQDLMTLDYWSLIPDFAVSEQKIPLVLFDSKENKVRLAILIDDQYKNGNEPAITEYDFYKFLKDRGYPIYIVNHLDWVLKPQKIQQELTQILEILKAKATNN